MKLEKVREELLACLPAIGGGEGGLTESHALIGPSSDRFHCPFPGCSRSFAELWRLKVHHRAPESVRGSGKERGHGIELPTCPRCMQTLQPGRHHVGCVSACSKRKQKKEEAGAPSAERVAKAQKRAAKAEASREAQRAQVPILSQGPVLGTCPWLPQLVPMTLPQQQQHQQILMMQRHHMQSPCLSTPQQQQQHAPAVPATEQGLASMFDDDDPLAWALTPPSPPPLPNDFSRGASALPATSSTNAFLFDFGQFNTRMPSANPNPSGGAKGGSDLSPNPFGNCYHNPSNGPPSSGGTTRQTSLPTSGELQSQFHEAPPPFFYNTRDDPDLLHMLFGEADQYPTMATIHLHNRGGYHQESTSQCDDEQPSSSTPTLRGAPCGLSGADASTAGGEVGRGLFSKHDGTDMSTEQTLAIMGGKILEDEDDEGMFDLRVSAAAATSLGLRVDGGIGDPPPAGPGRFSGCGETMDGLAHYPLSRMPMAEDQIWSMSS